MISTFENQVFANAKCSCILPFKSVWTIIGAHIQCFVATTLVPWVDSVVVWPNDAIRCQRHECIGRWKWNFATPMDNKHSVLHVWHTLSGQSAQCRDTMPNSCVGISDVQFESWGLRWNNPRWNHHTYTRFPLAIGTNTRVRPFSRPWRLDHARIVQSCGTRQREAPRSTTRPHPSPWYDQKSSNSTTIVHVVNVERELPRAWQCTRVASRQHTCVDSWQSHCPCECRNPWHHVDANPKPPH